MNKLTRNCVMSLVMASAVFSASAESQYLWSPCDLATLELDPGVTDLFLAGRTMDPAFTLSSDRAFPGVTFYVFNGDNVFDFGNATEVTIPALVVMNSGTAAYLRGGTWNLPGGTVYHGNYNSPDSSAFSLDGVTLKGADNAYLACGAGGLFCATNGAQVLDVNGLRLANGERNVADISGGSAFCLRGNAKSYIACGGGAGGNVVRFRNSTLSQAGGTYYQVYFCASSPTNRLRFSEGSAVSVTDARVFEGTDAKGNEMSFVGSSFTNKSSIVVADAAGADGNVLSFDGSVYHSSSQWNAFEFASKGSSNALVFANSAVEDPRWLRVGRDAGATGNEVRFVGQGCSWSIPACDQKCFGAGTGNRFVFDDCTLDNYSAYLYFYLSDTDRSNDSATGYENASTNNTVCLRNGAYLRPNLFFCNYACCSNTVAVDSGSTLAAMDIWIRGVGNAVVVSNGTVRVTQSGKGLVFGSEGDVPAGQPYVEGGNRLVLKGTSPKIANYGSSDYGAQAKFFDGSEIVIEVPESGYEADHVVFDGIGAKITYPSKLRFAGVEEYSKTLDQSVDIRLSNCSFDVLDVPEGVDFWAEVNADMPSGCYAYLDASGCLCLHVKRGRQSGLLIVVRGAEEHLPRAAQPITTHLMTETRIVEKLALKDEKKAFDAIWFGDSITHFWEACWEEDKATFNAKFPQYDILNFGFGGDRTQETLYFIEKSGILDGVTTPIVNLLIGTNNLWEDSPEDTALGVRECVRAIRRKQPGATVLLMSVLPREVAHERGGTDYRIDRPEGIRDQIMDRIVRLNELIRPLADGSRVLWVDLFDKFLDSDGLPAVNLFHDGTHPNSAGYTIIADAILPIYAEILKK